MRLRLAAAFAVTLLVPIAGTSHAAGSLTPSVQSLVSDDLSAKRKPKHKAAKKEQYLRAVPSTPPAGTKQ